MNTPRLNVSDDVLDEVLRCLSRGQKIEAVKMLRSAAGISLAEAKQLADQLAAEQGSQLPPASSRGDDWRSAAVQLLRDGKKLQAVKLCMQQTGSSLQLAKEKVGELAAREGIPDRSVGCLPIAVIAIMVGAAIAVAIGWALL